MPFSEMKGRFLVTTGLEQTPNSPPQSASAAAAPTPTSEHRVKRGRFTVSTCLPCARPRTLHSGDGPHVSKAPASRSNAALYCSSSAQGMSNYSSSDLDVSPIVGSRSSKDQHMSEYSWDSSSACSKASNNGLINCKQFRKVRFSEPGCHMTPAPECTGIISPTAATAKAGPCLKAPSRDASSTASKQQQTFLLSSTGSLPKPITRSYCRGRFVVQEAVFVSSLPRSMSMPDQCSELTHFLQAASSGAYAASPQEKQHLLDCGSGDGGGENYQHMSVLQQQQQDAVLAHAVVAAAAAGGYWAVTSATSIGESCGLGSSLSDDLLVCGTAGNNSAAAAAVEDKAARQQHHAPKRSHSVSYFRRGRFLVQTTYI